MNFIVGSGPAGISCAIALLDRGQPVTVLDPGIGLEPERASVVARMSSTKPTRWDEDAISSLRSGLQPRLSGVPRKLIYGSDYPYREDAASLPMQQVGVGLQASLATGGLSNVWGAAILPYAQQDMNGWPISADDLAPHYDAVLSFMPHSSPHDELSTLFPLHGKTQPTLQPSAQARSLLRDLRARSEAIHRQGFRFGASRLAVRAAPASGDGGCVYCGLCMYGCPYGLIYSAAHTLPQLQRHPRFRYETGFVVHRIEEHADGVRIIATRRSDGSQQTFDATRAFIAAGALNTTRILLESMNAHDKPLDLLDSQYFLLPWLRYSRSGKPSTEPLHTLCQAFLELDDPQVASRLIHMEVFTYSDLFPAALRNSLGALYRMLRWPIDSLLDRLLIIGGFLHSDDSAPMRVTLRSASANAPATLVVEARDPQRVRPPLRALVRKLMRNRSSFRALPVSLLLQIPAPGKGFHSGGTFPMRTSPASFESDRLGRPAGFDRIHAVDATVFPSIPATTITLAVMANAHRIGSAIGVLKP